MSKLPLYIRIACYLVSIVFGSVILIYTESFLLPIVIAALLSLLLYPVYKKLMDWKVPSILSIIISMLLIGILIGAATIVISSEIKTLIADISLQSAKIN